jgi:hypothetical protein
MLEEDLLRGFAVHDEVAAGLNEVYDALLLRAPIDPDHQAQV